LPNLEKQNWRNSLKQIYNKAFAASLLDGAWGMEPICLTAEFLVTQNGTMRIVSQSGSLSSAITGIPITVNTVDRGGLLDICCRSDLTQTE